MHWTAALSEATVRSTDEQGFACFSGIRDGSYRLRELEAPEGYAPLTSDAALTVQGREDPAVPGRVTGVDALAEIANRFGTILPSTGGPGAAGYVTLGALLTGAAVLLRPLSRRRRHG